MEVKEDSSERGNEEEMLIGQDRSVQGSDPPPPRQAIEEGREVWMDNRTGSSQYSNWRREEKGKKEKKGKEGKERKRRQEVEEPKMLIINTS